MIWLDGTLRDPARARIDPADRGLLLGDGVFETLRAAAGRPLHAALHLARLRVGAATLGIHPPWDDAAMLAAMTAVLASEPRDHAALRVTLTRGPAARGLLPPPGGRATLLVTTAPSPSGVPPARAIIAGCTRRNEHSPLSRIKSLNYGDAILARREAEARGADEAILLNTAGHVAEATASTLFVALGDALVTPPVADGALPGIARALLLRAGLAREARVTTDGLAACSSVFLSTSLGLRPLASIDGRALAPPDAALMAACRSALTDPAP